MKVSSLFLNALIVAASVSAAQAGVISSTTDPFPPELSFTSGDGCFSFAGFCGTNLRSSNYSYVSPPDFTGGDEHAHLTALFTGTFTDLNHNPLPGGDFAATGTLDFTIYGRESDNEIGEWTAQLTAEHVYVEAAGHTLDLTLDDSTPSMGEISIEPVQTLQPTDGNYNDGPQYLVDGAFTVFGKMTIDSGQPFQTGPFGIDAASVPEPATFALLILPLGAMALRLRRRS